MYYLFDCRSPTKLIRYLNLIFVCSGPWSLLHCYGPHINSKQPKPKQEKEEDEQGANDWERINAGACRRKTEVSPDWRRGGKVTDGGPGVDLDMCWFEKIIIMKNKLELSWVKVSLTGAKVYWPRDDWIEIRIKFKMVLMSVHSVQ